MPEATNVAEASPPDLTGKLLTALTRPSNWWGEGIAAMHLLQESHPRSRLSAFVFGFSGIDQFAPSESNIWLRECKSKH